MPIPPPLPRRRALARQSARANRSPASPDGRRAFLGRFLWGGKGGRLGAVLSLGGRLGRPGWWWWCLGGGALRPLWCPVGQSWALALGPFWAVFRLLGSLWGRLWGRLESSGSELGSLEETFFRSL